MRNLFPSRAIFSTLGALMQDPMLLDDGKIRLDREDFTAEGEPIFHVMIFATIHNLFAKGLTKITPIEIDEYLSEYTKNYEIFKENNGLNWCYEAIKLSKVENYEAYAEKVKKYSLLRRLVNEGISLEGVYEVTNEDDEHNGEAQAYFDSLSLDDVIRIVEDKVSQIATDYQVGYDRESSKAGDGGEALLDSFKETPMYGLSTQGEMQNTIFRGIMGKTSLLRSALTNTGKCITGDSIIFTDKGMIEIEDVINHYEYDPVLHTLEAEVISYEPDLKRQVKKTSHWYDMGVKDTLKIQTVHGYEIEGTPEHPVMINRYGEIMWCRLDEVTTEDYLVVSLNNQMFGNIKTGRDLSYLLGFLTGDGYNNVREGGIKPRKHLSFSKTDPAIYHPVYQMLKDNLRGVNKITPRPKTSPNTGTITLDHDYGNLETVEHLYELGLTMNTSAYKEIPKRILQGTKEDMVSFLQGLFDTDGSAAPMRNKHKELTGYYFEFSTASYKLAQQVQVALTNMGIVSSRREKVVNKRPYYIVTISTLSELTKFIQQIGFRLATEKQQKIANSITSKEFSSSNNDKYINKPLLRKLHEQLLREPNNDYHGKRIGNNYNFGGRAFQHVITRGAHNGCDRTNLLNGFETVGTSLEDPDILHIYNTVKNTMSSRVKTITKSKNRVYDFTVPETHSFVANGIISHNTRMSLGEATDLAINKWYNYKTNLWEDKGQKSKVLFISTEMSEDELQPTMWAYISGVPEEKIKDANLTAEEEERVRQAIRHLQECDLFIEYVPKFDPQTINSIIKEYATRENINVVFFDYIHLSFDIMISIANETRGMSMREDMMLNIFASGLEELARKYNFHLRTSTQMNGNASQVDQTTQMLDQSLLRGAKSMADKFQYGIIMTKPTEKELELLEPITSQGFGSLPNMVYHIYKNRKTKWKGKLYLHIDYDTMRVEELFFTDFSGKEIKVPRTVLEENDVDVIEEPF